MFSSLHLFTTMTIFTLTLFRFIPPVSDSAEDWYVINDGVMGGLSQSRVTLGPEGLVFRGAVSLENNGGFASMRSEARELQLQRFAGLRLHLRGDGHQYQLRLRQSETSREVAYVATFDTNGEEEWIELSFDQFQPRFRGRDVPEAGPLKPSQIHHLGFLIADKQAGPFRLEVKEIVGYERR
jgi:NADH dehydrogenase [ubiquinone] 1 alpha subcomplex assembly factor 1